MGTEIQLLIAGALLSMVGGLLQFFLDKYKQSIARMTDLKLKVYSELSSAMSDLLSIFFSCQESYLYPEKQRDAVKDNVGKGGEGLSFRVTEIETEALRGVAGSILRRLYPCILISQTELNKKLTSLEILLKDDDIVRPYEHIGNKYDLEDLGIHILKIREIWEETPPLIRDEFV